MQRIARLLAVLLVGGGLLVGVVAPASAGSQDGYCQSQEACLYYYTNFGGGVYDSPGDVVPYYFSWMKFKNGTGAGQHINDNSMSVRNNAWYLPVHVCRHQSFGGPCLKVNAGYSRSTLDTPSDGDPSNDLNNEVSSHYFY